ncbi:hypothetical protein G6F23_008598 [Rhizopus arrhizus]|nr:hypothetical protein G6F23_008598 [Rhizopus arrhizus]
MSQIPTSKWSLFWKIPVSPESRSLWYRLLHRKLYSQSLLSRFDNGLTSSRYAFNFFSPHLTFTQDDVCSILWSFQKFTFVDNTDLWTLSCCVLSIIWRAHWRFTIDDFPFIDKQLVTRAMSQFATLKRADSTLTSMFHRLNSVSLGTHNTRSQTTSGQDSAALWQTFTAYSKAIRGPNVKAFEDSAAKMVLRQRRQARIWIRSAEKNSVAFEMPKAVLPATFLKALAAQFSTAISVVPVKQGDHHGVIVAFDTVEAQTKACSIDVQIGSLTIIGTQTLSSDNSIYRISLHCLPILRPEELTPLVRQMLEPYGKVLHITTVLSSSLGEAWKPIAFTATNLDIPKPPVQYLKVVSSRPATDARVHSTSLEIAQNKEIAKLGLSDLAWTLNEMQQGKPATTTIDNIIPVESKVLPGSTISSEELQDQVENHTSQAKTQDLHHMYNTTEVSVSRYEVSKTHSINLTHSMSTHENNYNIMKQPNDLAIKDLDNSEDTESDSDYQPSAGDQSEVTESDTEEHGSEDEMDLDEEVRILQEEARAAQNSPAPSSD